MAALLDGDGLLLLLHDKERQRLTPAQRKEKKARANKRHGQRLRKQFTSPYIFTANIVDGAVVVPKPLPSRRPELLKLAKEINFCPYTREDIAAMFRGNYKDTYNLHHAVEAMRIVDEHGKSGYDYAAEARVATMREVDEHDKSGYDYAVEAMRIVDEHGKTGYQRRVETKRRSKEGRAAVAEALAAGAAALAAPAGPVLSSAPALAAFAAAYFPS
ncbi:expressed protein [Chlorella variabilis]|uniref:Expressed protein n=1 Tax=Chlorella variabilis TaxID=554065 RepID=E1ZTM3_CHLVA|nr:expressed protein [Chlorella variabilis]EFN50865.1 expressed protein [Chlorella variabilis]|eukprot:XP_005842967.1 expressed protein [Chlorella variabilis]